MCIRDRLEFLALYLHGCDNDDMTSVGLSENDGDRDNTDFRCV